MTVFGVEAVERGDVAIFPRDILHQTIGGLFVTMISKYIYVLYICIFSLHRSQLLLKIGLEEISHFQ